MSDSPSVHDPDELRLRRLGAGLNQDDLAELTGLDQSYISLLERGERKRPSAKTLKILAAALGCDITDLMPKRNRRRPRVARVAAVRATTEAKDKAALWTR
jgi:transcriptional regulator with XRE-family HTH domain